MLAEMGDQTFRMGDLATDSYDKVMASEAMFTALGDSMAECTPMCSDCGFLPYCGSDPVYHHTTQGDLVGFKPSSGFCQKNMGVLRKIFELLEVGRARHRRGGSQALGELGPFMLKLSTRCMPMGDGGTNRCRVYRWVRIRPVRLPDWIRRRLFTN